MPISIDEKFGASTKKEDVGFFESALAGVATGIWNIPKGFVSLGAELFDLIGDTNKAKAVDEWFDEVNPFDDEAEARTVGKVIEAITSIAPVAIGGAAVGIQAGRKLGERLAKKALAAKKANKSFSLARYGEKIIGAKSGAIVGGGVGEAVVADEDIGTFADMVKGTSLEPYAITMMDKSVDKEGRDEAGRRLLNRIKFGTEGALFNAAIAGIGKGITKLQKPTGQYIKKSTGEILSERQVKDLSLRPEEIEFVETGLQEYGDGLKGTLEKYWLGLRPQNTGTNQTFQGQRASISEIALQSEKAATISKRFNTDLKNTYDLIENKYLIGDNLTPIAKQEKFLETVQKIIEPDEGKKSLLKKLSKDRNISLAEAGELKKAKFKKSDYQVTKELEELKKFVIQATGRDDAAQPLINSIFKVRREIDNMSLETVGLGLPKEVVDVVKGNIGKYFTTEYKVFNSVSPLARYKVTGEQRQNAIKLFTEQEEQIYRSQNNLKATDKVPIEITNQAKRKAVIETEAFLRTRSIDEVDVASSEFTNGAKTVMDNPTKADVIATGPKVKFKRPDNTVAKEAEGIKVQTAALKEKILDPWQRELAGVIKDPSYTFYATILKQANLNSTVKYLDDINKLGSAEGVGKYVFTRDEVIDQFGESALQDTKRFKQYVSPSIGNAKLGGLTALDQKFIRAPLYDSIFNVTSNMLNKGGLGTAYKTMILLPKAVSQVAKTILSPITHIRNFISAGAFASANGIFFPSYGNIKELAPQLLGGKGMFSQAYGTSFKGTFGGKTAFAEKQLRQRMQRVDVLGSSVVGRDIDALVRDVFLDPGAMDKKAYQDLSTLAGKSGDALRKTYGKLQELYLKEDDYWKALTWGVERGRYSDIVENLGVNKNNYMKVLSAPVDATSIEFQTLAKEIGMEPKVLQNTSKYFRNLVKRTDVVGESFEGFLDEVGGSLVRDLVPNYNYIGRTGKALRQTPFGNFIAFPLEIMRTGNNIMAQAINEITSGLPGVKARGYQRLFGFGSTIVALPKALTEMYKAKNNVSNDELSALRKFVPEWSKNSTLLPVDRDENGYIKYVDFSYTNAYDPLLRPFRAVLNRIGDSSETKESLAEALGKGMMEGTVELLEPFASESIFTEALVDSTIRRGIGKNGRRVWQEADDPFIKIQKGIFHIAESFKPGSYEQLKRVTRTALGKTDPKYGESFNLDDEIKGVFGFRPIQVNPEKGLVFMTTRFGRQLKNASNLFNASMLKGGRVSPNKLLNTYEYSESRKFAEVKEMNQNIVAARELGVPEYKIRQKVKRQGISKDVFNDLMRGVYTPTRPSSFFIQRMSDITRDLNNKEGLDLPNPYFESLPTMNKIINENRNTDLTTGQLKFPKIEQINVQENISSATPVQLPSNPTSITSTNPSKINPLNKNVAVAQRGKEIFGEFDTIFRS